MQYDDQKAEPPGSSQVQRSSSRNRNKAYSRVASPQRQQEQTEHVLYQRDAPPRKNKTHVQKPMYEIPPTYDGEVQRR